MSKPAKVYTRRELSEIVNRLVEGQDRMLGILETLVQQVGIRAWPDITEALMALLKVRDEHIERK